MVYDFSAKFAHFFISESALKWKMTVACCFMTARLIRNLWLQRNENKKNISSLSRQIGARSDVVEFVPIIYQSIGDFSLRIFHLFVFAEALICYVRRRIGKCYF